jgi:tRNA-2-methylthio-N6-dimethylallyladenosine synthase
MSQINREADTIYPTDEQRQCMQSIKEQLDGKEMKYRIVTFGCQMNVHDSEKLAGMLIEMGFIEATSLDDADLILFNTCCVREHAEQRVYGNIGALRPYKQQNPNLLIGVCGCMMQQKEVADNISKKFPFVDLIFGTHNLHCFPKLLLEAMNSTHTVIEILDKEGNVVEGIPVQRASNISAWITIMYGCNNFCTYCIVPYVRGRERSRKPKDIIEEAKDLAFQGYKEITLLGQNVNSYGKDLDGKYLFSDLLKDINDIDNIERIRFVTSHPKDLSLDLIEAMAECEKVCEHLHLPIQSGSNRILRQMNRHYTRENYLELVRKIRQAIPDIALTTDIIVGFPGESSEDFQDTLDIIEKIRYDSAFTFLYSSRKGTPAATIVNQVDQDVKKQRLNILMELQTRISNEKNQKYLNQTVEVLVEGTSKNNPKVLSGRTRTNKLVHFEGSQKYIGKLVKVKISRSKAWTLEGIML